MTATTVAAAPVSPARAQTARNRFDACRQVFSFNTTRALCTPKPGPRWDLIEVGFVDEDGYRTPAGDEWVAAYELREAIERTTPSRCRIMTVKERKAVKAKLVERFDRATLREYCEDKRSRCEKAMDRACRNNGGLNLHQAIRGVSMEYVRLEIVEEALAESDPHRRFCEEFLGL